MIPKNINILMVDDQSVVRQLLKNLLEKLGFKNVDEASDGKSALEKMISKKYDLIISDWKMTPMSGIDLARTIRATGNKVPIVMLTSNSSTLNEDEAEKAGVSYFLSKEINLSDLNKKISIILGP